MSKKIVIIGGVAGGASAAARLRRLSEDYEILLIEKGGYISFANCGLPYYIGGVIEERDELFLQTPAAMKARFNVDVRVKSEVISVDTIHKKIQIEDHVSGLVYEEAYHTLVLSPGSTPVIPNIEGIKEDGIFTIWNVDDCDKIYRYIKDNNPKNAVVVGGGFIGAEMAENLQKRGMSVAIVEAQNQILPQLDLDMAALLLSHMQSKGVKVLAGKKVQRFRKDGALTIIELDGQESIAAELVIWCAGVRPNTAFLRSSNVKLNEKGGIIVDSYMQTGEADVYAVGDAVEVEHFIGREKTMIPLAGPANKQGRIVADNIAGKKRKYNGTLGTSILKIFDMTGASVGYTERQLDAKGIDYIYSVATPASNATYYPGSARLFVKLIYSQDGTIYGGQIIGAKGVDKRIDVLATAIRLKANVYDLTELELAYAPPFSSAKDPINMIGYVAMNVIENRLRMAYWDEIENVDYSKTILLDVRFQAEWDRYHIDSAILIPLDSLRNHITMLDKEKEIIVICAQGQRAYIASRILVDNGFKNVRVLTGGMNYYQTIMEMTKNS